MAKTKKVKFKNGKVYTYTKSPSSKYWERNVGPENDRRKVRLHSDIVSGGNGEEYEGSGKDIHHKNKNKDHNTKNNLSRMSKEKHTAIGKNAKKNWKSKVKRYLKKKNDT